MKRLVGGILVSLLAVSGCRSTAAPSVRSQRATVEVDSTSQAPAVSPSTAVTAPETSETYGAGEDGRIVRLAQFTGDDAATPLVNPASPEPLPADQQPAADLPEPLPPPTPEPLALEDVITAVYASYPALDAVARERQIAAGKQLAAMGQFDTFLAADAISEPLGFYENYRYDLGVKRYAWGGGETFAGYRLGRGAFEPWYLERETNKGGEFKAGFAIPFLQGRDIDKRRAAVFKAQIERTAAEPLVQLEVIDAVLGASMAYWYWVASGQQAEISRNLLALATERQAGLRQRVEQGDLPAIELVDNERLIAARRAKLIDAEQKLQQAAIKLSLFLRNPAGLPLLATEDLLPSAFPQAQPMNQGREPALITQALTRRPELWMLRLERERAQVDMQLASNMLLPELNGVMAASQDVGEPTSAKRDKSELELEAGAMLDVPLQRRAARGELQAAQGKLTQVAAKQRLTEQKIVTEVQSAATALTADYRVLQELRRTAELARRMVEAERIRFDQGDSNILLVNLREQAAADAELLVVAAAMDYFTSRAELRAATAAELAENN